MPKGGKLIKKAAMITNYCCVFAAVLFVYLLIEYAQMSDKFKSGFTEGARTRFVAMVVVFIIMHLFRSFASGTAQRRAYLPDSSKRIITLCVPALVLSVIWLVVLIVQMTSNVWMVSIQYIETILLVMVIIDIIGFSLIIYGAAQSRAQDGSPMDMASAPKGVESELPPIALPKKNSGNRQE